MLRCEPREAGNTVTHRKVDERAQYQQRTLAYAACQGNGALEAARPHSFNEPFDRAAPSIVPQSSVFSTPPSGVCSILATNDLGEGESVKLSGALNTLRVVLNLLLIYLELSE